MITELGHFALILAFAVAILQSTVPLVGAQKGWGGWMAVAAPAATASRASSRPAWLVPRKRLGAPTITSSPAETAALAVAMSTGNSAIPAPSARAAAPRRRATIPKITSASLLTQSWLR